MLKNMGIAIKHYALFTMTKKRRLYLLVPKKGYTIVSAAAPVVTLSTLFQK